MWYYEAFEHLLANRKAVPVTRPCQCRDSNKCRMEEMETRCHAPVNYGLCYRLASIGGNGRVLYRVAAW